MLESDYIRNSGGEVTEGYDKDRGVYLVNGLYSNRIFGEKPLKSEEIKDSSRDNIRGYITLNKPVINYILARSSASLLRKLLNISKSVMMEILNFNLVYSISRDKIVNIAEIESVSDMLCYGELIKLLIDRFDIETEICSEFKRLIAAKFFKDKENLNIGEVTKYDGKIELLGNYFYTPNERYAPYVNGAEITNYFLEEFLKTGEERIVYLLNLHTKDKLYGMIMEHLIVLPVGLRPTFQNRHDPLTKQYNAIIIANNELKFTNTGDYTIQEVVIQYRALDKLVRGIVVKYFDETKKNYKAVYQMLSGKEGFIRGNMLKKRADYSGRSIIVVDPKLSIDECGLPYKMIPKLYNAHYIKTMNRLGFSKFSEETDEAVVEALKNAGVFKYIPTMLNRAPTLHTLSYLAYYVVPVVSKAIHLNPLACPGYNADFDGDSMAAHVPQSDAAIWEAQSLMLATHNLFVPANGKCSIVPRQEIIYGLNVATSNKYDIADIKGIYSDLDLLNDDVMMHRIKVYDTVKLNNVVGLAGRFAFMRCLPQDMWGYVKEITMKSIMEYVEQLLDHSLEDFKNSINKMVLLGFRMAMLYAPPLSIFSEIKDEWVKDPFKQFHKNMEVATMLYEKGFDEEDSYNSKFNKELDIVQREVVSRIKDSIGHDNGFVRMVESGARGNEDNLVQIFSFKGRIAKSSSEAFNAVIENSFVNQLTPLEHYMSAYGGRKGVIDKVHRTADTGYAMRRMWHVTSDMIVECEDCGTTKGISITKSEISRHLRGDSEDPIKKRAKIDTVFYDMVLGRYMAHDDKLLTGELNNEIRNRIKDLERTGGSSENISDLKHRINVNEQIKEKLNKSGDFITKSIAEDLMVSHEKVVIRSPITCKNPCCAKCYGTDLSIHGEAAVGLPIGIVAAESIGEPGTQLTMRTFHKGGVAGKTDVTNDFDRLESFIDLSRIGKNGLPTYDPIAWETGTVKESLVGIGKKEIMIGSSRRSKSITASAEIKKAVTKGEGLCLQEGDHDVLEVMEYLGIEAAQMYLLFALYHTYLGRAAINLKHFEVLVANMTLHLIVKTDRPDLKVGDYYTSKELYSRNIEGTKYKTVLKGTTAVASLKQNALSNILMEDIIEGLSRAVLMEHAERFDGFLPAVAMGLKPRMGSSFNSFIQERFRKERCREWK
jgi:DNA-directed RNA polymerase subunit beta'